MLGAASLLTRSVTGFARVVDEVARGWSLDRGVSLVDGAGG
jgi:hypothetical protein